jgi:hypothetical protein
MLRNANNMKPACVILAAAVLSFGQTTDKKAPAPENTAKKAQSPAKPDTWERSKECAAQAEKVVAGWSQRTGFTPTEWSNHYSHKYDKCFISLSFLNASRDEKVFPTLFSNVLVDAFERSNIAYACTIIGHPDCVEHLVKIKRDGFLDSMSVALNGKPFAEASPAEQETALAAVDRAKYDARASVSSFCSIDDKPVDCDKAKEFITDHMKN